MAIIDKTILIEQIIQHLSQNEDSFTQAVENYLGCEARIHPHDSDLCIVESHEDEEPQNDLIYGQVCYG